jgi:hypothetical protein
VKKEQKKEVEEKKAVSALPLIVVVLLGDR